MPDLEVEILPEPTVIELEVDRPAAAVIQLLDRPGPGPGVGGDVCFYEHPQDTASKVWVAVHGFVTDAVVTCIDSADNEFEPDAIHHEPGVATILMNSAQGGRAICVTGCQPS